MPLIFQVKIFSTDNLISNIFGLNNDFSHQSSCLFVLSMNHD